MGYEVDRFLHGDCACSVDELKDDEPPKGVPVAQATYPPSPPKPQRVQPIQGNSNSLKTLIHIKT